MAKTLKQILDGTKSSTKKTKDILGNQPGVDYSPKAGDERKFADKHHIEKHADRVGNGDDVYNATNVKQDTTARHGHKSREDEKVYEEFEIDENYFNDAPARDSFDSHGSTANFHAETARQHAIAALVHTKTKEHDKAKKHQAAAEAHQKADLAHAIAGYHHSSRHVSRHDSSIAAHKASKEANKLSDIAHNIGIKHFKEEAIDEAAKCNKTKAGVECPVHGMKNCLKEDDIPSANAPGSSSGAGSVYNTGSAATSTQTNLKGLDALLSGDQPRAGKCNLSEAGKLCEVHGMKQCPSSNKKVLNEKPPVKEGFVFRDKWRSADRSKKAEFHHDPTTGEVKVTHHEAGKHLPSMDKKFSSGSDAMKHIKKYIGEEVLDELLVQNYVSGSKNKSAEVHKNMNAGNYTVKKMAGGKEVGSSEHDDSSSAHAAAKKHLGEELTEDKVKVHYSGSPYHGKTVEVTKRNSDGSVHVRMQHSEGPEGRMRTGVLKPGQYIDNVKEDVEEHLGEDLDPYNPKDTGFDFKYGGQNKGRRAEVHRMPGGHYEVRKYKNPKFDLGTGEHVETVKHTDRVKAGIEAQNFANMKEEVELDEKALAKSKQTVLVTAKGTKSAGGVMRIKKSEYDPKKHDLAEDEEINEISKGKAIKTYAQAGSAGDYGMTDKTFSQGERLLGHIKRKFGDEAGKHAEKAASAAYWGRGTPTPGKDSLTPHVKMRVTASGKVNKQDVVSKKKEIKSRLGVKEETEIEERKMTDAEMKKREDIVMGMKKKLSDFRSRYGKRAKDVMYATATKQAMKEDLAQPLIGSTDPEKDKKKKKMEQSAPAVTPITLPNFSVDVNTGRNV